MKKKYRIWWNAGYGESSDVIEAETEEEAEQIAYQNWLYDAESEADYGAKESEDEK